MLIYTNIQFDFSTHANIHSCQGETKAWTEKLDASVDVRVKDTHLNLRTWMALAAESRTERFWASFQLSLRTNLSIERKSGNESKHSDAITHIHMHKRARNQASSGCWWNGKLVRSGVDLFKVSMRVRVCIYTFRFRRLAFERFGHFLFCHCLRV